MAAVSYGKVGLVVALAASVCGCANGGFDIPTGSITPQQTAAKSDPVCASLASQINTLKADGAIERLEKAADGKTSKVSVKRASLQKQTELNKAYEQFQTRCGPALPNQVAAQQPAQQSPVAAQ